MNNILNLKIMELNFKSIRNYAIVAMSALALASCTNDEFMNDAPLKAEGMASAPQGILPGVQPANGAWVTSSIRKTFKGYYKSHGNNLSNPFSLSEGTWTEYSPGGRAFNGYYYTLNNTNTGQRGIRKMRASGTNLSDVKTLQTSGGGVSKSQKDEVNFTLFDATHGYYTDGQKGDYYYGEIVEFNPATMQTTRVFNVRELIGSKLKKVMGTSSYDLNYNHSDIKEKRMGTKLLIRRGNYLYADITFGKERNQLNQIIQSTDNVYVAVINVGSSNPTLEKVLVGENATNIGLFNDHPLVNIDPISNAIYFATVGDMEEEYKNKGKAGVYSKIFKIADSGNGVPSSIQEVTSYKKAQKEAYNKTDREGEFNTLYAYNDVVYTKIATQSVRYMDLGWHGQEYRKPIWKYVKISGGTVTPIQFQNDNGTLEDLRDNFFAYQQPQLINGKIYMISNTESGSKVYKITPGNTNATLVTVGTPGGWGWGLAKPDKISSIVKL